MKSQTIAMIFFVLVVVCAITAFAANDLALKEMSKGLAVIAMLLSIKHLHESNQKDENHPNRSY